MSKTSAELTSEILCAAVAEHVLSNSHPGHKLGEELGAAYIALYSAIENARKNKLKNGFMDLSE